ncbi:MAG: hypothetical protein AAF376_11355 [Pseudomonadota bacterium]
MPDPETLYADLAATHLQIERVSTGRMLKSDALTIDGKSYAYLSEGGLVVKLPKARVTELVEDGTGEALRVGARVMREWVVVPFDHKDQWPELMQSALEFVRG